MLSMGGLSDVVHCLRGIAGKREAGSSQRCTLWKGPRQRSHVATRENLDY